jgi:2-oxoglutarate/2-oxoacid ferredoxin oxidoreductase subunit alpha
MSSTHVAVRPEQAHHTPPTVNNFSIQVATVNGSGSQTANLVLLRSILLMGVPVSGKNMFPSNIAWSPDLVHNPRESARIRRTEEGGRSPRRDER